MAQDNPVEKLYRSVIDDVVSNVRENFLDEGVDEHVLQELRQIWEAKLAQSKALESPPLLALQIPTQERSQAEMPRLYTTVTQGGQQQVQSRVTMSAAAATATLALPEGVQIYQPVLSLDAAGAKSGQPFPSYQTVQRVVTTQAGQVLTTTNGASYPQQIVQIAQQPGGGQQIVTTAAPTPIHIVQQRPPQPQPQPQSQQSSRAGPTSTVIQVDGGNDTSSDEDDFDEKDDENDADDDDENNDENNDFTTIDEEPLNSGDDVSDEDAQDLFDTENVVVCQYDKINRIRSKWKFHLKDGIMNLQGKDYVFQKATGDAEW